MYLKSDILLLADVFENFREMCFKTYQLDPVKFISSSGLAWQAVLQKTEVNLELLTDTNMQLMVEKRIRGGICHAIHRYAKANKLITSVWKIIIEIKNHYILNILM